MPSLIPLVNTTLMFRRTFRISINRWIIIKNLSIVILKHLSISILRMTISQTLIQQSTIHGFKRKQNRVFLSLTKTLLMLTMRFNIFNLNLFQRIINGCIIYGCIMDGCISFWLINMICFYREWKAYGWDLVFLWFATIVEDLFLMHGIYWDWGDHWTVFEV